MEDPRQVWLREIASVEIDEEAAERNLVPRSPAVAEPDFPSPLSWFAPASGAPGSAP